MRLTSRAFIAAAGVLVVIAVTGFLLIPTDSLYGQNDRDSWVPDLHGAWWIELSAYSFENVTDQDCQPEYFHESSQSDQVKIVDQTGRVFAGIIDDPTGDDGKLAGVIMPDRTVSIQIFDPSEFKMFVTGKLAVSGGRLEISGYCHMYDEFGIREFPDKTMGAGYIRLTKVD